MFSRLTMLGVGTTICAIYGYKMTDYHYVDPPSTSNTSIKEYIPIPVDIKNKLDYKLYEQVLSEFVVDGKVKYIELRKSMMRDKQKDSCFIHWLQLLSKVGPNETVTLFKNKDDELKFYINAYNALCIWGVLYHSFYYKLRKRELISSVMDVKSRLEIKNGFGFFKAPMYILDGDRTISLDHLEHNIIRDKFKDARIHCAINCASNGCPKLQSFVIDVKDLDRLCQEFVNQEMNVFIDKTNKIIRLSQIFKWYEQDFQMFYNQQSDENKALFKNNKLLYFIFKYANQKLKDDIKLIIANDFKIEWISYDWSLNHLAVPIQI